MPPNHMWPTYIHKIDIKYFRHGFPSSSFLHIIQSSLVLLFESRVIWLLVNEVAFKLCHHSSVNLLTTSLFLLHQPYTYNAHTTQCYRALTSELV